MPEPRVADPGWALTWCRGTDAVSFLQGLLSADLEGRTGSVMRSFLLSPQGKVTALVWLLVGDDEVGIIGDEGIASEMRSTLGRFRIRVDAGLEESDERVLLHLGPREAPEGGWRREPGRIVADLSRLGEERTLVIGGPAPTHTMPAVTYLAHRIRQGEPVVGRDVGEGTIPQETGLVAEAVSFTKGCYLGQELVARIDTRGHVNQRLMRVESSAVFAEGDVLSGNDKEATITSAAPVPGGTIGLAMVRRELPTGQAVVISTSSGRVAGMVYDLDP